MIQLWLFVLSYLAHHVGNILLLKKILNKKSIDGLCIDTQIMLLIGAILRVIWVFDSQLKSMWIVWIQLPCSIGIHAYIVYIIHKYKDILYIETKFQYRWFIVVPIMLILAFFLNPGDQWMTLQIFVSGSMFIEAVALWPQIDLFHRTVDSSGLSKIYSYFMAGSRFIRLLFWICMWIQGEIFWQLLLADILHIILVSNFIKNNLSSISKNKSFLLLSNEKRRD